MSRAAPWRRAPVRAATLGVAVVLAVAAAACSHPVAGRMPAAPADAQFVDLGNLSVRVSDHGRGPTVVLIHGFASSLDSWRGVDQVLARRFRVVSLDLAGFGWTSRPEGDYSPAAQARMVWAVLDRLGVADAALVGHSWGSSVVLAMALAEPARVRRIALYDAFVYDEQVPSSFRWSQLPGVGELIFALTYKHNLEERVAFAYYDQRLVNELRIDHVRDELERPGTNWAALAAVRGQHFAAQSARYPAIHQPALLLWGENDQVTPLAFGQRLANELGDAELVSFPRCGHLPMVEARVPSTRALLGFLARDLDAAPTEGGR